MEVMHWRVPIDDANTRVVFMSFEPKPGVRSPEGADVAYEYVKPMLTEDGEYDLKSFFSQDQMALETQGAIYDRTNENLGLSDRGIVLFRRMLDEQMTLVEQGKEPTIAVVRDPAKNRIIEFPGISSPVEGLRRIEAVRRVSGTHG
jgi:5,5'-dehydrodivanillate O-demethylase